jgi:restriction endonuclease S subunit
MKKKLAELADIDSGYSFRSSVDQDPDGDIWVLRPGDIEAGGTLPRENLTRTSLSKKPRDRYFVDAGVVLFVTYGESNRAYWFDDLPPSTIAGSAFTIIRPTEEAPLRPSYLAWYMNQAPARAFYEAFRRSSTTSRISRRSLGALEVPVPPAATQGHIAEIDKLLEREVRLTTELLNKRRQLRDHQLLQIVEEES